MYVVRLEKFIDDPLIKIGIINLTSYFDQGHMWKTQLKFQLKMLNGVELSKFLSLVFGRALSS